jgi:hypothetical protein
MTVSRRDDACAGVHTVAALEPDSLEIGRLVEMALRPRPS